MQLAHGELALVLGRAAEEATRGLLRAGATRTVGEPRAGGGHASLELCLRPRAGAPPLDLSGALRAAGHALGPRRAPLSYCLCK